MNRERAKKLLPIIQAFADGKTIQCKCSNNDTFEDMRNCDWINTHEYRIKPEPFECWVEFSPNGNSVGYAENGRFETKNTSNRVVFMREVQE